VHENAGGYVKVFEPQHPHADPAGYVYQHRINFEKHCRKTLPTESVIHHLNGDPSDNRIENLTHESASTHYLQHNAWKKLLGRPIRIFCVAWHISHQYQLFRSIPHAEFYMVVNPIRKWGVYRPLPANVFEVPQYEPGKYDVAILNIDQQCIDDSFGKSKLYRELNAVITDIPKIVINHGTPYWPEMFTDDFLKMKMKMLLGNNYVVVNSNRAKEMWGDIGREVNVIIHGLDPDEWFDLPKEPRVITSLSPAGLERYYNRALLYDVKEKLKERGIPHAWISVDVKFNGEGGGFDAYRDFIGRSLIYFNPTLESPMPRSRTEAMLSGSCVVTLNNQDTDRFIEHGKNGFFVPNNPAVVADLLTGLINGFYGKCVEIGQEGKKTAREHFHMSRFQSEWRALLERVIAENKK